MTGNIFTETLRRGWRVMVYWGIGMGLYSVINTIISQEDAFPTHVLMASIVCRVC